MNLAKFLKFVAMLMVLLSLASPVVLAKKNGGGGGKGGGEDAGNVRKEGRPAIPSVTAVSDSSITIGTKTYKVNGWTEVYIDSVKSKIADVQNGMEGSIATADGVTASTIQLHKSAGESEAADPVKTGKKNKKQ